jgi:hypothetical protein
MTGPPAPPRLPDAGTGEDGLHNKKAAYEAAFISAPHVPR